MKRPSELKPTTSLAIISNYDLKKTEPGLYSSRVGLLNSWTDQYSIMLRFVLREIAITKLY